MRKRVLATDLQALRSLESQCQVDEVIDAEVKLSGVEERHERAGAGVRLHRHLHGRGLARHFGQTARQCIEDSAWWIAADGYRARKLLCPCSTEPKEEEHSTNR